MSDFDSILRVALEDDTVFDGLLRLAQEQGCSLRDFLKGIALNPESIQHTLRPSLHCNTAATDRESIERIAERQGLRALTDPIGLCRELGRLSVDLEKHSTASKESQELCNDSIDMELFQRIAERQNLRALTDPIGLCRELGKLSEYPAIRAMTADDWRELCED